MALKNKWKPKKKHIASLISDHDHTSPPPAPPPPTSFWRNVMALGYSFLRCFLIFWVVQYTMKQICWWNFSKTMHMTAVTHFNKKSVKDQIYRLKYLEISILTYE